MERGGSWGNVPRFQIVADDIVFLPLVIPVGSHGIACRPEPLNVGLQRRNVPD